ncbi:hypothetical protein SAMN05428963_11059 [Consotaella salsifontis]|uniref:Uncharacterized protein n=1 Tax=Consotaella salsifontis TaxID=1365950 RepID=A0A1T4SEM7_9HYPH|nr:hypothetical protein SAMN05428963_11059 [Consotaella salsifontis]
MGKRRGTYEIDFGRGWSSGYREYRYGSLRPVTLAGKKPDPVFRGDQREHAVERAMGVLRDWKQSPFEHEGPVRAGIRSALCLRGHGWHKADRQAETIVSDAFQLLGVKRPKWEEGQRHYVEPRENCKWCSAPIEDGDRLSGFCCLEHARAAHQHWGFETRTNANRAYAEVSRAISRLGQKPRVCDQCGARFRPQWETSQQRFCSRECLALSQRVPTRVFTCAACGKGFEVDATTSRGSRGRRFCSPECGKMAPKLQPTTIRECVVCGSRFAAKSSLAKFCGNACSLTHGRLSRGKMPKSATPTAFDYMLVQQGARITGEVRLVA